MTKTVTTAQAIVECLTRNGVRHVFGIPGAHTYSLFDALHERRDDIRFVGTRHEQGAGYMAYGYAKSTGRPGVYTCVPGPGILNTTAALCTAYAGNAPVLCLTSEIPSREIGRGHGILHELPDQLALLRGLTKWAERINHPADAPRLVTDAMRHLLSDRVRPVALECPWDTLAQTAPVSFDVGAARRVPPSPDPVAIESAAKLLASARNPLIMVGAGALDATTEIRQLAELMQAPVTAHRSGRGIVDEETPFGMSMAAAYRYWSTADVLLAIGTRMELQFLRWRTFPKGLKIVRIDIDPLEMARREVDIGIVTDAALGTRALVDALTNMTPPRTRRAAEFELLKLRARRDFECVQPQVAYLDAIRSALPRDGFLVEEICQVGFAARFAFPVYAPRTYVTCGYQDNLGFGFMTALGVKIAHPDKAVVSINGDGGFMFGVQELATAVQQRINVVAIVFNNGSFGNVLRDQKNAFGGRFIGERLRNPDFMKLAESFGAIGYRAHSAAELRATLERALQDDAPVLIEVPGEPGAEASPWPFIHPWA